MVKIMSTRKIKIKDSKHSKIQESKDQGREGRIEGRKSISISELPPAASMTDGQIYILGVDVTLSRRSQEGMLSTAKLASLAPLARGTEKKKTKSLPRKTVAGARRGDYL